MNRLLFKSIREYMKQSILAPLFVVLEVLMEVLIPFQMAKIIDEGIQGQNLTYVIEVGLVLVVMAMLALFFGALAGKFAAEAGAGYAKNLRHDIFYKIQQFSFKNIDHFSTSSLVTRMTTDITNVQMAYMMTIRLLARAPVMIILSWIMTLTINVDIALLFLAAIPVLGFLLIFIAKKAHKYFIKVFDEYDVLNNDVQENVNAARVVKAYVREDHEIKKFHGVSQTVFQLFTKAEKIVAFNNPVMMFVMYTVILVMVLIGGQAIVFGSMEAGELTSVLVYAMQILMSLMMVSFVFVLIMIAEASTDRITEVLKDCLLYTSDDQRFLGQPGEIKTTYKNGYRVDTKIGSDGRAELERHYTDHRQPWAHTNPHDHPINWDNPAGFPDPQPPINYPDGAPEFKNFERRFYMMKNTIVPSNSLEQNRFTTISDFQTCMRWHGEVEFLWNGVHYSITHRNGRIYISHSGIQETERSFATSGDILEYEVDSYQLRDIITKVTVVFRSV